jgi:hypothetical protein
VRVKLRELGERRERLRVQRGQLAEDTAAALLEAYGLIPVTEAASLCRVARSTAYVLSRKGDEGAHGKAAVAAEGSA